jgi:hypothetical protein
MNNDNQRLLYFMGRLIKPEMKEPYIKNYNDSLAWKSDTEKYNGHLNFLWETGIPVSEYWKAIWKNGEWKTEGIDYQLLHKSFMEDGTPCLTSSELAALSKYIAIPLPEEKESIPVQGTGVETKSKTKNMIPAKIDNPNGLHKRYVISKVDGVDRHEDFFGNPYFTVKTKPVDTDSEYFVMRLDGRGSDIEHIKACRIGVHAYANAIEHHLPELAKDLRERYPLLNNTTNGK